MQHLASPGMSRRTFIRATGAGLGLVLYGRLDGRSVALASAPAALLEPGDIPKFRTPLLVPPVMPRHAVLVARGGKPVDYYEISVRQFVQQVLPAGLPATTLWGYGALSSRSRRGIQLHHAPSLTIEASHGRPVRVKWVNELLRDDGSFLPHLLPVDPTLHWANPPGGMAGSDTRPVFSQTPGPYRGPVPLVTHVHGAVGVGDESDGYPEAWYLPNAKDLPAGYATHGRWYGFFAGRAMDRFGVEWGPGYATFQYPNQDRASTKWYHDHSLGMTRLNVYAGPAGFYLVRGGPEGDKAVMDTRTGMPAVLPGPAPREGDDLTSRKTYREIPLAIQDRAFAVDGSLLYPDSRASFDGIVADYIPTGEYSPIWNPEFFGNTLIVNGNTWPYLDVEQRRYRFRLLNGCQSRFLILDFGSVPGARAWVIGNEGGFLAAPVDLATQAAGRLLMAPAERADVVVDFGGVPVGSHVLRNLGPDEPFGGGQPGGEPPEGFEQADPEGTGLVLELRVRPASEPDPTTPPEFLRLPAPPPPSQEDRVRRLSLVEVMGSGRDAEGSVVEGPVEALLGLVEEGRVEGRLWMDEVTENPGVGDTEVWELYNTTADAHPIHVHEIAFEVLNREGLVAVDDEVVQPVQLDGEVRAPESWETGVKDTVVAYPAEVTRIRARFDQPGQYVWHCHIVEHEDNEMMRPLRIGPTQPGQPGPP